MSDYASEKYLEAKKWVSKKITDGYSWDDVKTLCVSIDEAKNEFIQLRDDELILPEDMEFREWSEFIDEMKKGYSAISDPYGLSNGFAGTALPIPTDPGSPWTQYKKYLLGQKDGKRRISDNAVTQIEKNSHWILNHILRDTRVTGPKKGLVMGSVQSGKTANMIGLATMAAHYDWNYIIILSGTIDNLRKQTRDRFMHDLLASGGVAWHILDKSLQDQFSVSLDVYSNIVCLCPLCHRKIHYGMENEKKIMLDSIYAKRSSRLAKSGIRMSQDEFVRFTNHTF